MLNRCLLSLAILLVAITAAAQQQSPMPELPADVPKDAEVRVLLMDKTPSGQDAIWQSADGAIHEFFQFNDRGRGPKIYTTYRLDANGLILSEESNGVDYMKSPVEEHFSLVDGKAAWKNQAEDEKQAGANGKFFIDLNGGPESGAILARALLNPKNNGTLPVLPPNLNFVHYGIVDTDGDALPDDYSMRWSTAGVTTGARMILVTPSGILKCTAATTASCS